jgi:hypothetical protein
VPTGLRVAPRGLPPFLEEVRLRNLRVGQASVDLDLLQYDTDVGVNVARPDGKVQTATVR